MRHVQGLERLCAAETDYLNIEKLTGLLLKDLRDCHFSIYGQSPQQLLAQLDLASDGLFYEQFDKRIDLTLHGKIACKDSPPLTYSLQGEHLAISGRCSILPQVCGVDLYLNHYDEETGEVRQNFSIQVKQLHRQLYPQPSPATSGIPR